MNGEQWGATGTILVLVYGWGCLNRGWTSPVDTGVYIACGRGVHRWCRHDQPSSQAQDDETPDTGPPVSTPGPLRPPQTLATPAFGPQPIEALAHVRYGRDPASSDRQQGESGPAWTRRMLESGLLGLGEIDQVGAQKLGVHPDTVRRWRRQLGGTRRPDESEPTP